MAAVLACRPDWPCGLTNGDAIERVLCHKRFCSLIFGLQTRQRMLTLLKQLTDPFAQTDLNGLAFDTPGQRSHGCPDFNS